MSAEMCRAVVLYSEKTVPNARLSAGSEAQLAATPSAEAARGSLHSPVRHSHAVLQRPRHRLLRRPSHAPHPAPQDRLSLLLPLLPSTSSLLHRLSSLTAPSRPVGSFPDRQSLFLRLPLSLVGEGNLAPRFLFFSLRIAIRAHPRVSMYRALYIFSLSLCRSIVVATRTLLDSSSCFLITTALYDH